MLHKICMDINSSHFFLSKTKMLEIFLLDPWGYWATMQTQVQLLCHWKLEWRGCEVSKTLLILLMFQKSGIHQLRLVVCPINLQGFLHPRWGNRSPVAWCFYTLIWILRPKTTSDVGGLQDDYGFMPLHYVVEPKFLDTDHDFSHIESQDITDTKCPTCVL